VLEDLLPHQLEMMRLMVLAMDPPRHAEVRHPLNASFSARAIATLEARVREICRDILEDGEVEFVHAIAAELPSRVSGGLMGLPREDWKLIQTLAERVTSGDFDVAAQASIEMAIYAMNFATGRRAEPPREDLTSMILGESLGMSDLDFGSFFVQLITAANDTTKTMLSSGLLALLEHPAAMAELRADPRLIPGSVEEILRWANPLHYFRRTATADTELRGVTIRAGDKVALSYTSANRDEDVFDDPDRFDIHRHPNPHLAFGAGEHFCLGAHLARLEGRVFFEELLATFPVIELTGTPVRLRSNLNNSLVSLPVRLTRT
jgi:cytochrome P450